MYQLTQPALAVAHFGCHPVGICFCLCSCSCRCMFSFTHPRLPPTPLNPSKLRTPGPNFLHCQRNYVRPSCVTNLRDGTLLNRTFGSDTLGHTAQKQTETQ